MSNRKFFTVLIIIGLGIFLYSCTNAVKFTLNFDSNGGSEVVPIISDTTSAVSIPKDPSKEGYRFDGWFWDNDTFETPFTANSLFDEPIVSNMTVYAKWTALSFDITYELNGGTNNEDNPTSFDVNTTLSLNDPTKAGFSFGGWYSDAEVTTVFNPSVLPFEVIVLYAKWNINQYTITFDTNQGSEITALTQDYMTTVAQPDEPTKVGYTFGGWYSNETFTTAYMFTTIPAQDITVYAKWNINSYTLQYVDYDGTILQTADYTFEEDLSTVLPPVANLKGYSFTDWDISLPMTMPADDVTLTAQYSINQYTITFESNAGSLVSAITRNYGRRITAPVVPTKDGYTFAGWYRDEACTISYSFTIMSDESITLYAKWLLATYTISYELYDGIYEDPNPKTYTIFTDDFTFHAPIKEGYSFIGWYDHADFSGDKVTFKPQGMHGNLVLYAKWEINQYVINYYITPSIYVEIFPGETIESFAIGGMHYAFLTSSGRVFTWGYNNTGALGNGTTLSENTPTDITSQFNLTEGEVIIDISLGLSFSSALTSTGRLFTWGNNSEGQLGGGTNDYVAHSRPIDITNRFNLIEGETIESISLGWFHAAALTSSGRMFIWGSNDSLQLGDGSATSRYTPTEITSRFNLFADEKIVYISLGRWNSSALTSMGRCFNWGTLIVAEGLWQGKSTLSDITSNFNLNEGEIIDRISLGPNHTAALTSDGRIFTWGLNNVGQLGDGTTTSKFTPTDITNNFNLIEGETIVSVSLGNAFSLALTSTGRLFTWGENIKGQLGDGTIINKSIPIEITSQFNLDVEETIISSSAGSSHTSALTSTGRFFSWGYSSYLLGNGVYDYYYNILIPTETKKIAPVYQETLGNFSTITEYIPNNEGYTFSGWYLITDLNQLYVFETMPTHDLYLVGYWTLSIYNIDYHLDGGTSNLKSALKYTYLHTITLPYAYKTGHTFGGWYDNDVFSGDPVTIIPSGSTGDITLYAKFVINQYTVTFDVDGGSPIDAVNQDYGLPITEPTEPIKEGYVFAGWYTTAQFTEQFGFTTMIVENWTLFAKWIPNE